MEQKAEKTGFHLKGNDEVFQPVLKDYSALGSFQLPRFIHYNLHISLK